MFSTSSDSFRLRVSRDSTSDHVFLGDSGQYDVVECSPCGGLNREEWRTAVKTFVVFFSESDFLVAPKQFNKGKLFLLFLFIYAR